jgi:Leucine-rich repeat (LRR) protein
MDRFESCDRGGQFELDISGLSITEWPRQMSIFPTVRKLYAFANMLKVVPSLSYYTGIETINISRNRLEDISGIQFSKIRTLKNLDVSRNLLTYLPADLVALPILENLQVHRNKLTALPAGISNIRSLKILNAEYNEICEITEDLGLLPKLVDLNLARNPHLDMAKIPFNTLMAIELRNSMADKHERKVMIGRTLDLTRKLRNSEISMLLNRE